MINIKRLLTFFFLFGLAIYGSNCAEGGPIELFNKNTDSDSGKTVDNGKDPAANVPEEPETRKVDIKASSVTASLNPQFQFVLPTGNSGNPTSPHFDDFIDLWREHRYWNVPFSRERVLPEAAATLMLVPAETN